MKHATERRRAPRVAADIELRCEQGGRSGVARVRDISASGVRCVTDSAMPLMTQVGLVLQIPGTGAPREIVCRGAVVRSGPIGDGASRGTGGFETAIFFTDVTESDRVWLEEFVSSRSRRN
jgi:hypothetical protein